MNRPFRVGDMVRPKAEHQRGGPPFPSGRVYKVEPFGRLGQMLYVGDSRRGYLSRIFDLVPRGEMAA